MSFLDKAKDAAGDAVGKASELKEKATEAVEALDEKTGGKIGEAKEKAEDLAEKAKSKLPTDKFPGRGDKA
jgi:hypothetical protein